MSQDKTESPWRKSTISTRYVHNAVFAPIDTMSVMCSVPLLLQIVRSNLKTLETMMAKLDPHKTI